MNVTSKNFITMTTINTSSINLFNKFLTYFSNKRIHFTINHTPTNHTITLFDLTPTQTNHLLSLFTHHFHLNPALQPLALAA